MAMNRRFAACLLAAAASLSLCGCGSVFDTEYVVETTFAPSLSAVSAEQSDATVHTLEELIEVLRAMVSQGAGGRIAFNPSYEGDVSADMASACWQIRTQDALCAYCVENIAYDVSKIVNHFEATVSVIYSEATGDVRDFVHLPYAADAGEALRGAMAEGRTTLVLLSEHSSYTAEAMGDFAVQIYRDDPAVAPQEPKVSVSMVSGAGPQRLYELRFDYGLSASTLRARRAALASLLEPFADEDAAAMDEPERALLACLYLSSRCRYVEDPAKSNIYSALVENQSDSAGMAYAYLALCRRLSLPCQIVEGQYNRETRYWNIIRIDGEYYHVDPAACSLLGLEAGFLLSDEDVWGPYRWDYFTYPHCTGKLYYAGLLSIAERPPAPTPSPALPAAASPSPVPASQPASPAPESAADEKNEINP